MKTKIYNGPNITPENSKKRGVATLKTKNRRGRFLLMQNPPRHPLVIKTVEQTPDGPRTRLVKI